MDSTNADLLIEIYKKAKAPNITAVKVVFKISCKMLFEGI